MQVTTITNFCRVFEFPKEFSEEYCFGGGIPTTFNMVDWFNPITMEKVFMVMSDCEINKYRKDLTAFIKTKRYYAPEKKFLVITDFNDSFII